MRNRGISIIYLIIIQFSKCTKNFLNTFLFIRVFRCNLTVSVALVLHLVCVLCASRFMFSSDRSQPVSLSVGVLVSLVRTPHPLLTMCNCDTSNWQSRIEYTLYFYYNRRNQNVRSPRAHNWHDRYLNIAMALKLHRLCRYCSIKSINEVILKGGSTRIYIFYLTRFHVIVLVGFSSLLFWVIKNPI